MSAPPTILVGVEPDQHPAVLAAAVALARSMGARVVCAHADLARVVVEEHDDGSQTTAPLDPDLGDTGPGPFPEELGERVERVLADAGVDGEVREVAGDPATALGRLAERLDALMVVVGTRRPGVRGAVGEFFDGSVAVHLSHRQHRPVLVVPQAPVADGLLPWEEA